MNREDISDIIDLVNEQRDSCGMITRENLIEAINKKLQQKQLPTDEEIWDAWDEKLENGDEFLSMDWLEGAKWMREQLT